MVHRNKVQLKKIILVNILHVQCILPASDCPACYNLVQEKVNIHRQKLSDLENLIINIGNNPSAFNDTQFLSYMNQVNDSVVMLLDEARGAVSK